MNFNTFKNIYEESADPIRSLIRLAIKRFKIGEYETRIKNGAVNRPHYAHCVYQAAVLGKKLGYKTISVLEFGVAGGNGLIELENHAFEVSKITGVDIQIYGFDMGSGLPQPLDYRDMPYLWKKGFYKMDVDKLKLKLNKAKLVLGDVSETVKTFFEEYKPAPIGAIMNDLDFYSSTKNSFKLLDGHENNFLPRVFCYFDDVTAREPHLYNDYTGERLAINEFNQEHSDIKFGLPYYLITKEIVRQWYHHIWILHFFSHAKYNNFVHGENLQLPCD
jgi:hypothetical protein